MRLLKIPIVLINFLAPLSCQIKDPRSVLWYVPEPVLFAYLSMYFGMYLDAYFGMYFLCTCGMPPGFLLVCVGAVRPPAFCMYSRLHFCLHNCLHFCLYSDRAPSLNRAIIPRADKRHLVHPSVQFTTRSFRTASCFFNRMKLVKTAGQNSRSKCRANHPLITPQTPNHSPSYPTQFLDSRPRARSLHPISSLPLPSITQTVPR